MADEESGLVVSVAGDCIIQHRTSAFKEPRFLELVDVLRGSDLSIANLEGVIPDAGDWPGFIAGQGGWGSPYMAVPPWVVEELRWYGFGLVFTANNHASDFAEGGILSTLRHLDEGGMLHSGSGANMSAATAPTYAYTAKGRVAVINASDNGIRNRGSTPFPTPRGCLAADQGPWFKDRPGINMIRYEPIYHVDQQVFDTLRRASQEIGWEADKELRRRSGGLQMPSVGTSTADQRADTESLFHYNSTKYMLDDRFYFETVPAAEDLERNYKWIREARRNADVVIVGLHQQGASWDENEPPDHSRIFARGAIDAGADLFVGHGHGRLGGVEVYKDGVIIYGVPGFILNHVTQRTRVPQEQLERCGLAADSTPADMGDLSKRTMGIGLYDEKFGLSNPTKGLALFTVVFGADHRVERVLVRPTFERGDMRTGGGPILAEPGSDVHKAVLDLVRIRTGESGTALHVTPEGVGVIDVAALRASA
jgi:poly-gamma-glutamate capsule biosynthesis protein CapA/YwtB (metallophosphatase superfamily)